MKTPSCVVIDYGIGNIFSVMQALHKCGAKAELSSDRAKILNADRVILPGVGAFGRAVDTLRKMGLDDTIQEVITKERPFLGICVGMQVMMEEGLEFGRQKGLGLFKGKVVKVNMNDESGASVRVPLIGWNTPIPTTADRWSDTPFAVAASRTDYYFVHSFEAKVNDFSDVAATVPVGAGHVTAAIHKNNVIGVQFHPEKSSLGGQAFLSGFMAL